ncbi:hypothetical protein Tco_0724279 [Tanacetum coccineum]
MVQRAVLMKSGLVSVNTARQVNAAHSKTTVNDARPMPKAVVNAARPKAVVNAVKGNNVNTIKASACWVWKLKTKGNPQMYLQDQGVIDSGCSRHMTGNMSYLTDYEEINGGCVAFGGNPKGGKITGKEQSTSGFTRLRSKNRKRVLVRKRIKRIGINLQLLVNVNAVEAKPAESEGFEQIVDFLNAHTIKYSLTVNPIIYTSCIEQFWATDKAKTVNRDVQLQALVDGKKIIITELIVRRDL